MNGIPHTRRFHADQVTEIAEAKRLREWAVALRDSVSEGSYNDVDLKQFWRITEAAGVILAASNPELSTRAGLGGSFFATVAREQRRPRLQNLLKALTAVIETANERLADVEIEAPGMRGELAWVRNPLADDSGFAEELHRQLLAITEQLKHSNSLSQIPELDRHWRSTLIDLLETTIAMLRAPLVEKSMIQKTGNALDSVPTTLASSSASRFVSELASQAAKSVWKLFGLT